VRRQDEVISQAAWQGLAVFRKWNLGTRVSKNPGFWGIFKPASLGLYVVETRVWWVWFFCTVENCGAISPVLINKPTSNCTAINAKRRSETLILCLGLIIKWSWVTILLGSLFLSLCKLLYFFHHLIMKCSIVCITTIIVIYLLDFYSTHLLLVYGVLFQPH